MEMHRCRTESGFSRLPCPRLFASDGIQLRAPSTFGHVHLLSDTLYTSRTAAAGEGARLQPGVDSDRGVNYPKHGIAFGRRVSRRRRSRNIGSLQEVVNVDIWRTHRVRRAVPPNDTQLLRL
jgi:hypothetical protein